MVVTTLNTANLSALLAFHPGVLETARGTNYPYFDQRFIPRVMIKSKDCKTIILKDNSEINELQPETKEINDSYTTTYTIYKKCCDRWTLIQNATVLDNEDRTVFNVGDNGSGKYKVVLSFSLTYTTNQGTFTETKTMTCYLNLNCCVGLKDKLICKATKLIDDLGAIVNQWGEIGRDVTQKMKDLLMLDHYLYLLKNYCLSCSELETVGCALNKFKNC